MNFTSLFRIVGFLVVTSCLCCESGAAIVLGGSNDFQGGSTESWRHGVATGNSPVVVSDVGPDGLGDHVMEFSSTGGFGAGSRFLAYNSGGSSGWTGNYLAAGVSGIQLDIKNTGASDLHLRLAFDGAGGDFVTSSISVGSGSGWQTLQFAIAPSDLIAVGAGFDSSATLGSVHRFQIMSALNTPAVSGNGLPLGDLITASAQFDNITAVPEPSGVALAAFVPLVIGLVRRRRLKK